MAARRKAGLDEQAVAELRERVAGGKRVRVQLSGPQFSDATTGSVVRVGDPATDGTDFITVRVSVNGIADELAFAPSELQLPARAKAAKPAAAARTKPAAKTTAPASPDAPAKARSRAPRAPARRQPTTSEAPLVPSATRTQPPAPSPATAQQAPKSSTSAHPARAATGRTAREPRPVTSSSRARRSSPAPQISITVTSAGATWSVAASRGARSLAKNHPLAPGVVTALAALLAHEGIAAAVAEVNDTALAEANERAAHLRAELARLDEVLAAHRPPR